MAVLAVTIFAAVLLNNAHPIFYVPHYEMGDLASNSLQIFQAKHFHLLLGHYCRFGFYHPGPGFFYVYAASEALFYDGLRLVPTPFNAQLIALYALSAFFFAATLGVIGRHLESTARKWFWGLALLVAACHFGAVGKYYEFMSSHEGLFSIWPPCVLILPFLCLLVAGASVACGAGRDLPLMALAACFLVHGHVGMPLFVVPITLVVYGSLMMWWRRGRSGRVAWPWQAFPRQHWLAGAIIVLFLTPIVIDMVASTPSNVQLVINHLRSNYGQRKGLLRAVLYFLQFGAYAPYPNSNTIPAFENFDLPGTLEFFRVHWRAYGLWLVVVVTPLLLMRTRAAYADHQDDNRRTSNLNSFLARMYLVVCSAVALTLVWGHIQEGPMYYYNALFNFGIYYALLLIFAITVANWIAYGVLAWLARSGSSWRNPLRKMTTIGPLLIALVAVAAFVHEARRFRYVEKDAAEQRLFATTLQRAVKIDSIQPKLLIFEGQAWAETVGVALYLQRGGEEWYVGDYAPSIPLIFGRDRAIPDKETAIRLPHASVWRVVSTASGLNILAKESGVMVLPLAKDIDLVIRPSL